MRRFTNRKLILTTLGLLICLPVATAFADTTDSSTYGSGNYGHCDYGSCSITLTSTGAVALNVSPTGAGVCTIASDIASVLTNNEAGYTLTLANSSTNTSMLNGGETMTATTGTSASPIALTANKWGFRVDGLGGFGAGPTSAVSNVAIPSTTFAGVPASNVTAATLANTSAPANPAEDLEVWYGLCANTAKPSGTYTTQVTYTATTN